MLTLGPSHGGDALVEDIDVAERQVSDAPVSSLLVDRHVIVAVDATVAVAVLGKREMEELEERFVAAAF